MLMDRESPEEFSMPAQSLFKERPEVGDRQDYGAYTGTQMNRHGIDRAMLDAGKFSEANTPTLRAHPDRSFGSYEV